MALTYGQVYALARSTGLTHDQAITATAVSGAEVNGDAPAATIRTDAVGDVGLQNAKWGPSVGLWQIRSLKAETGTGRSRDVVQLKDPSFNARAMYEISSAGRDWSPWSTYNDGKYRKHLAAATTAAGGATSTLPDSPTYPAKGGPAVTVAQGNSPFDIDVNLGPLSGPIEGLVKAAGPIALGSLIVAGGVALVVVGIWRTAK
jgi:hypothetical protein